MYQSIKRCCFSGRLHRSGLPALRFVEGLEGECCLQRTRSLSAPAGDSSSPWRQRRRVEVEAVAVRQCAALCCRSSPGRPREQLVIALIRINRKFFKFILKSGRFGINTGLQLSSGYYSVIYDILCEFEFLSKTSSDYEFSEWDRQWISFLNF